MIKCIEIDCGLLNLDFSLMNSLTKIRVAQNRNFNWDILYNKYDTF